MRHDDGAQQRPLATSPEDAVPQGQAGATDQMEPQGQAGESDGERPQGQAATPEQAVPQGSGTGGAGAPRDRFAPTADSPPSAPPSALDQQGPGARPRPRPGTARPAPAAVRVREAAARGAAASARPAGTPGHDVGRSPAGAVAAGSPARPGTSPGSATTSPGGSPSPTGASTPGGAISPIGAPTHGSSSSPSGAANPGATASSTDGPTTARRALPRTVFHGIQARSAHSRPDQARPTALPASVEIVDPGGEQDHGDTRRRGFGSAIGLPLASDHVGDRTSVSGTLSEDGATDVASRGARTSSASGPDADHPVRAGAAATTGAGRGADRPGAPPAAPVAPRGRRPGHRMRRVLAAAAAVVVLGVGAVTVSTLGGSDQGGNLASTRDADREGVEPTRETGPDVEVPGTPDGETPGAPGATPDTTPDSENEALPDAPTTAPEEDRPGRGDADSSTDEEGTSPSDGFTSGLQGARMAQLARPELVGTQGLAVGDCLTRDGFETRTQDVELVPCEGRSQVQVVDEVELEMVPYPGSAELLPLAWEACAQAVDDDPPPGVDPEQDLVLSAVVPDREQYESGDRTALCVVVTSEEDAWMTGPLLEAGPDAGPGG